MNHAKLLDCTLRDGAYLINKTFGDTTIKGIIEGLVESKIDYIEIGFLQNDGFGEGKTVFRNSEDAKRFIPKDKQGCNFTVLADYSRYSIENLDECTENSVDAVRECFYKKERYDAMAACQIIKDKGYKLFIQPVDILGYTDIELVEFLQMVNELEPYCLSIVDTFGSMYQEDLHRIFELINHNLIPTCKIGFHSHNNLQLSSALSQEFIRITTGKREVVVDVTINGMGRGAGNTPTELMAQYMVSQLGYGYDIDAILDVIDEYMDNIKFRCSWGYSTPFFVAGCYSAHVNNITYLLRKNSIRSKDMRYILNKIGPVARKRYDYGLLEKTYLDLLQCDINDEKAIANLKLELANHNILILVPGSTLISEIDKIYDYIKQTTPIIIAVNFVHDTIKADYIYMSNIKRYHYWKNNKIFLSHKKIFTSNIAEGYSLENTEIVSFMRLVKCGWEHLDNSAIMLLRLLDIIKVSSIAIAGFDGYNIGNITNGNYAKQELELQSNTIDPISINVEIKEMLSDYLTTRKNKECPLLFITDSRFSDI